MRSVEYALNRSRFDVLLELDVFGNWMYSFLRDRTQSVMVDGHASAPAPVLSGVPQGSVLGPIIFLILLGDIDDDVTNSFISRFADDTRIGRAVNNAADSQMLQSDLDSVYRWATVKNMAFNEEKFETIHYGNNISSADIVSYKTCTGTDIERKNTVKDLGVQTDDDCRFRTQIATVVSKVKRVTGWILRTFETRERLPLLTLWKSLILPILDYCVQLWCPIEKGHIQDIENLQRSFTRQILGLRDQDYWQRLKTLKLYSLQRRRERYHIIYIWKMIEGLVPNSPKISTIKNPRRGRFISLPDYKNLRCKAVQKIRDNSFAQRAGRLFNSLPIHVRAVSGCTVDTFKSVLDRWLSTVDDQPSVTGYVNCYRDNSLV